MVYAWPQEVLTALEEGKISPVEAFRKLKELDNIPAAKKTVLSPAERILNVLRELDALVGLAEIKKLVREIYAYIEIRKRRQKENLNTQPLVLHMIFKGNPGTGKTTVARILGKIFLEMGVLSKGHLIEVERADLVGEYIGHTAQKTREQLQKACGGILFIDEAYSLARGGEKDFGKEAIDCMVKAMEDHKDELILILAGYRQEMEMFLNINPGLRSRFPIQIDFPDYSKQELLQIAEQICLKREYRLNLEAKNTLLTAFGKKERVGECFGNARTVRNIIERAIRRQAVRLMAKPNVSREELMNLEAGDLMEVGECARA
jgi:stage V sporulation protein K